MPALGLATLQLSLPLPVYGRQSYWPVPVPGEEPKRTYRSMSPLAPVVAMVRLLAPDGTATVNSLKSLLALVELTDELTGTPLLKALPLLGGVPVKFWPVTLAPLTVTARLAGLKV